jgi:fructose-bisphosphate aldolase, class II
MEAMTMLSASRFQEFNTVGQASRIKKVISVAEIAKRYAKGDLKQKFA